MTKTQRLPLVLLFLSAGLAVASDDYPYPRVEQRIDINDRAQVELLRQGGMSIGEAGHNGLRTASAGKCSGPGINKAWPACNHADLQFFAASVDAPGTLAIVTGGSGGCQDSGGLGVPLVDFHGDDWNSYWKSAGATRCRTPDTYQVGEFQEDGTTGLTATSTTLWQLRPWSESGKPLPPGFDKDVAWMEAQCSGFLEIDTFGYNGGN
jgi:hypothetical protein